MAQSAVTVRMDSEMKTQFDALCEQFGMSANTAFNIFVKAVIRSRSIPFAIKGSPSASDLFMQQRSTAELSQEAELSLEEINEEIRAAREEIRKKEECEGMIYAVIDTNVLVSALITHNSLSATASVGEQIANWYANK